MKNPFRLLVPALVLMLLAPAARLHAGEPEGETPPLTLGRKVRFIAPEIGPGLRVGRIVAEDGDTLTVNVKGGPLRVRRDALASLEVSDRKSRWKKGTLVGGAIGCGLFALAGAQRDEGLIEFTAGELAPVGAVFGALTGAIVGAFIQDDHWQAVSPERLRVSVGPVPGRGVGASVSLRF